MKIIKNTFRSTIEKSVRKIIFKKSLPKRFKGNHQFYVTPDAQLKYIKLGDTSFDKVLLDTVEYFINENSIVWDIGANVGVFSYSAAAQGATVIATEPDLFLVNLIMKSKRLKRNNDLKVTILPIANGKKDTVNNLLIANRGRASNALETSFGMKTQMGGVRDIISVPIMKLDTMLCGKIPPPTFLKIDVEGSEVDVLAGATKILKEIRPIIFIEADIRTRPKVDAILNANNYVLYENIEDVKNGAFVHGQIKKKDTIAIPKNK